MLFACIFNDIFWEQNLQLHTRRSTDTHARLADVVVVAVTDE